MSNGFGTINTRNINEIVASLVKQIKDIKTDFAKDYTVLNNKLEKCEEVLQDLKDYIDTVEDDIESEYQNLKTQIENFDEEIAEIRAELSQVNYRKIGNETVAVGIAPISAYSATSSIYPFSAKYSVNDSDGNNIVDTYATKVELGNTSATLSADYIQKIAKSSSEGMSELSSVSGLLDERIVNEAQERQSKDNELERAISEEYNRAVLSEENLYDEISSTSSILNQFITNEYNRAESAEQLLENTKQNVLSAGDGIAITNDVVSHSIKVIENNDQEDTIEDTIMTVYLKNNHYKVITLDPTVTEIHFWITKTESNVLQETGFEFQVPENSELNDLEFRIIDDNKKIYTILPRLYKAPNIYQGTIVNYRCTVGEYEVED